MRGISQSARGVRRTRAVQMESLEERVLFTAYVVAPWGDNAAMGSLEHPWQTLQYAIDAAAPGDTISLRAGHYDGNVRIDTPRLTVRSYPLETAYIDTPNDDESIVAAISLGEDATGVRLVNLDVSGGGYYTLKTESNWDTGAPGEHGTSNLLVYGCRLHDSGRDVVKLVPGSNNVRIIGTEIYNSGRRDPSNAEGIDAVNANYLRVEASYIHDTTTNGIYAKGGSVGTLIYHNTVSNITHSGIILGQLSDDNWFDNRIDPQHYESIDGVVRDNRITNTGGSGVAAWAALRPTIAGNTMVNVAQSMMGGILVTGETHYLPDEVLTPSVNVTITGNVVHVFSDRPVVDIREGSLTGGLYMAGNYYDQGSGRTPQFWDERSGFQGSLAAWQRQLGTDYGSVAAS